ncbi:MAG TPA: hypothetical protein VJZ68_03055 [Nitrososphaera sp.]|nr:hypothetical protein [Nitrososphaera sp.]
MFSKKRRQRGVELVQRAPQAILQIDALRAGVLKQGILGRLPQPVKRLVTASCRCEGLGRSRSQRSFDN